MAGMTQIIRSWVVRVGIAAAGLAAGCFTSHGEEDAADVADARTDARDDAAVREDAAVDGADVADTTPPPASILFRLRFVSDVPGEGLFVAEWDAAHASGHWLTLLRDGAAFGKAAPCEICPCDDCPACPVCGAPCMDATTLLAGSSVEYRWDGNEYLGSTCPVAPPAQCFLAQAAPAGSYTARFCWGTGVTNAPCDDEILDVTCQEVPFTVPDADGLVEYTIDWGG
jgi:hypothetical protein